MERDEEGRKLIGSLNQLGPPTREAAMIVLLLKLGSKLRVLVHAYACEELNSAGTRQCIQCRQTNPNKKQQIDIH